MDKTCLFSVSCTVILIACILLSGCTSSSVSEYTPTATATPVPTSPTIIATALATPVATVTTTGLKTYMNTEYGIALSYPGDWEVQEPDSLALRDYGRSTINIVNFYSPGQNIYAVFSVDIDPTSATDLESYYNHGSRRAGPGAV